MSASRVFSLGELPTSNSITSGSPRLPLRPGVVRLGEAEEIRVDPVSREDLRWELHAFAKEALHVELLGLQEGIRQDVQQVVSDMLQSFQHVKVTQPAQLLEHSYQHNPEQEPSSLNGFASTSEVCPDQQEQCSKLDMQTQLSTTGTPRKRISFPSQVGDSVEATDQSLLAPEAQVAVQRLSNVVKEYNGDASTPRSLANQKWKQSEKSKSSRLRKRSSTSLKIRSDFQQKLIWFVNHRFFDNAVALLIVTNGVLIGWQTDFMAQNLLEDPTYPFQVAELVLCFAFTFELTLRLMAYRCEFFTSAENKGWNIFEFLVVLFQLVEIGMSVLAAGVGVSFSLLRALRLIRVVRLARALRLIRELKTLVQAIVCSVKPLFWTCVLLFLIAYVAGIGIMQMVHSTRVDMIKNGEKVPDVLELYWATLPIATWTMIQSITGGVDWANVCRPILDHVGVEVAIFFTCYILFAHLAMLNVVTGVFIDSVMQHGRFEKEQATRSHVQTLLLSLDVNQEGKITWDEFANHLEKQEMKDFFKTVDVEMEHAKALFELLDLDETGALGVREFMEGCLKIWAPARGLDLRMIMRDINKLHHTVIANSIVANHHVFTGDSDEINDQQAVLSKFDDELANASPSHNSEMLAA